MGMAASQSRYLGLTARKTNVEYEGQQVNQQRTALANQSANLFRELMGLDSPIPPEQTKFYKDEYTFNDLSSADGKSHVSSITPNADGSTYTVIYTTKEAVSTYGGVSKQNVSVTGTTGDRTIQLPNGKTYKLSDKTKITKEQAEEFNKLGLTDYKNKDTDDYYCFTDTTNNMKYYINATETGFNPGKTDPQKVDLFTVGTTQVDKTHKVENATVGKGNDGNYNSLKWTDSSGTTYSYDMTKGAAYDEKGYNQAMQEYNVKNLLYQKKIADINAKTEQLQQTDRTLELRLKQLDTEQQALQTEMDSVKKVIDKNVDNVFKTFQ